MTERITREEARTAAAHLQELIAGSGTLAQRLDAIAVVNYLEQPPEDDAAVWKDITEAIDQLTRSTGLHHRILTVNGTMGILAKWNSNDTSAVSYTITDGAWRSLPALRVKLREMVGPLVPTLDEVAGIVDSLSPGWELQESDCATLKRYIAAQRTKGTDQ